MIERSCFVKGRNILTLCAIVIFSKYIVFLLVCLCISLFIFNMLIKTLTVVFMHCACGLKFRDSLGCGLLDYDSL